MTNYTLTSYVKDSGEWLKNATTEHEDIESLDAMFELTENGFRYGWPAGTSRLVSKTPEGDVIEDVIF